VTFLASIADKPWLTQGILSITAVPTIKRYHPTFAEKSITVNGVKLYRPPTARPTPKVNAMLTNWRNNSFIADILGTRYASLKKFLTYPYMLVELTTFTGSPVIIKPEHWQDADATIREQAALVPPGQRVVFSVNRYNADSETSDDSTDFANDDRGEYLDMAATLDNFPSLPIVNDMAINYLASNKHGLAFQFASADWSQQRALRGAATEYGQAEQGINLENRLTRISVAANSQQANLNSGLTAGHATLGGIGAIGGGALAGAALGPEGAAAGALGGAVQAGIGAAQSAVDMIGMQARAAIQNQAAQQSNAARVGTSQYVADTNRSLAQFAARGDYQNQIAGINAKIQDSRMLQPSTSGQFGGDAFNLVNGNFGFSLRWKMINKSAMKAIGDFWLRYGYAVQQFTTIPTNFQCMTKFTYWKLSETYISQGNFPEGFKQVLRGIFEKGVTVWQHPEDIGNIDWADNQPIDGISY
jgi:hypothetical protein